MLLRWLLKPYNIVIYQRYNDIPQIAATSKITSEITVVAFVSFFIILTVTFMISIHKNPSLVAYKLGSALSVTCIT